LFAIRIGIEVSVLIDSNTYHPPRTHTHTQQTPRVHPMSSAETEAAAAAHHYTVAKADDHNNAHNAVSFAPSSFHHPALELERLSPPNSSTSSTAGGGPSQQSSSSSSSSFLRTAHPSTPQGGNGYFYSPAHTPYKLEGSPIVDRHNNYEVGTSVPSSLQAGGPDCGGGGGMVNWKADANQFELLYPPRSAVFLKDDDELMVWFFFLSFFLCALQTPDFILKWGLRRPEQSNGGFILEDEHFMDGRVRVIVDPIKYRF
jgi:hypothetical protein